MQYNKYTHAHTHTHIHTSLIPPWKDQCEWHRMTTKMTGPDCAVMCNVINTHTCTHIYNVLFGSVPTPPHLYPADVPDGSTGPPPRRSPAAERVAREPRRRRDATQQCSKIGDDNRLERRRRLWRRFRGGPEATASLRQRGAAVPTPPPDGRGRRLPGARSSRSFREQWRWRERRGPFFGCQQRPRNFPNKTIPAGTSYLLDGEGQRQKKQSRRC